MITKKMSPPRKISVHDIARVARVSIGTVDRALNGRDEINAETRKRVLRVARRLGYKPNLAARLLAVGRARLSVGVCIPHPQHYLLFWEEIRDGILEEARRFESVGVSVLFRRAPRLGVGEFERVRELLDNDVRAIILAPGDPRGLAPLIEEAETRKIPVLCVSSDAPQTARSTVICVDPELNARCAAELMAKFLPANSKVAIVAGMLQVEDHRRKIKGFSETFPRFCKGGEIVDVIENHEDEKEGFQKCVSLLRRYRSIDGLYVAMGMCLPVCEALEGAGLSGKVRLITTDLYPKMVPYFRRGIISASIYQRPRTQGRTAVHLAVDHIVNGVPIPPSYYLNPQIVLQSNLSLFPEVSSRKIAKGVEPLIDSAVDTLLTSARQ
jgi:LacI family transcriptional regulator